MKTHHVAGLVSFAALALALAGCDGSSATDAGADARRDVGATTDTGGTEQDSGDLQDSGTHDLDASLVEDDAYEPDAMMGDTQVPVDDAPAVDFDSAVDAAPPPEAGVMGCPAALPTQGASCTRAGLRCSYGTTAALNCRDFATCAAQTSGGPTWQVIDNTCRPTLNLCPRVAPTDGAACTVNEQLCTYANGTRCRCNAAGDAGARTWACGTPARGCPVPTVPNLGTPCATTGQRCDYATCDTSGWYLQCSGGVWTQLVPLCRGIRPR